MSEITCYHANETPRGTCVCLADCKCRETMCKEKDQIWSPPKNGSTPMKWRKQAWYLLDRIESTKGTRYLSANAIKRKLIREALHEAYGDGFADA